MIDLDELEQRLTSPPGWGQFAIKDELLVLIAELRASRRVVAAAIALNPRRRHTYAATAEQIQEMDAALAELEGP